MAHNKLPWGQNPSDEPIESPWRFLAGLDLENGRQIRRVMAMVLEHMGRRQFVTSQNRWQRLHRKQRLSVQRMLRETKGNYLLYDILVWFAEHLNGSSRESYEAMQTLKDKTTFYARYRKTYYQEYKKAKKEWKAFRGASWDGERDRDEDTEDEGMDETGDGGRPPRKTLEDKQRRMETYKVKYVREDKFVDQENIPTESEDSDEDDLDDDESEEEVNIFAGIPKVQGRTRSGVSRRNEVWEQLPANLSNPDQLPLTPNKRKPERTIVVDTGSFGDIHDIDDTGAELNFDNVPDEKTMKWLAQYTSTPPKISSTKSVHWADELPEANLWNTNPMGMGAKGPLPRGKAQDFAVAPPPRRILPKPGPKGGEKMDFGVYPQNDLFATSMTPVVKTPKTPSTTSTDRPAKKKQKNSPYDMTQDLFSTPIPPKKKSVKPKQGELLESQMSGMGISGPTKKRGRPPGTKKRRAESSDSDYVD